MKGREIFKLEGDKITRLRRHCPKCGDGFFLAEHKNRVSCGKCGYTEYKSGGKIIPKPIKNENKSEQVAELNKEKKDIKL
jgi:small subunit ribosomal protein S27Ae